VRFLYIAVAAALLGPIGVVRADECMVAIDESACPDDGDPCTLDRCAGGICTHVDVPNRSTCDPVIASYLHTVGLDTLVGELETQLATMTLPDTARGLLAAALDATTGALVRAADALAGRIVMPEPAPGETLAQARARAAFGIARGVPPRVRSVVRVLRFPAVRAAGGSATVDLAQRARFLYRSSNQLKRELRALQRVSGVFAR
jgi:hypothetical protein